MELRKIEKISKALGDISRLKIIQHMQCNRNRIECMELAGILNLAQPSISHHIKKLTEAELIEPRKEGRFHNYVLNTKLLKEYTSSLQKLGTVQT